MVGIYQGPKTNSDQEGSILSRRSLRKVLQFCVQVLLKHSYFPVKRVDDRFPVPHLQYL